MQQAGPMDRRHRTTELDADVDRFRRLRRPVLLEHLFECAAADELHRQADLVPDLLDAEDGDHVRVPYPREQPSLVDDRERRAIA